MKSNLPPKVAGPRGMSLLELALVITVMLSLVGIVFIASKAWKRGGDRAHCVLTLRNMQVAARSYQNLYGYNYGGRPYAENGTQDIARLLFDKGYIERKLFEQAKGDQPCAGGGSYVCATPDIFPPAGQLYLACSLQTSEGHRPEVGPDW